MKRIRICDTRDVNVLIPVIILEDRYLYSRAIASANAICIGGLALVRSFVRFEETENRVRNDSTLVAFGTVRYLFTRTSAVSISLIKISPMKISRRYRQHLLQREAKVAAFSRANGRRLVPVYSGLIEQARGLVCTLSPRSLALCASFSTILSFSFSFFFLVAAGIVKS